MAEADSTHRRCAVEGCSGAHKARGYCRKHYKQWQRRGVRPSSQECRHCGKSYTPTSTQSMYCSKACGRAAWNKANPEKAQARGMPRYCRVRTSECKQCGTTFVARRRRELCSRACIRAWNADRARMRAEGSHQAEPRQCRECEATFTPKYGDKRRSFCSSRCLSRHYRRIRRSKERARLRAAQVEPVNPVAVFERDGWRCQICGKDTPRARRGTRYPNAPELDHRIPLSRGGEHSYANTQCACRRCNHAKGNASEVGQLPLLAA